MIPLTRLNGRPFYLNAEIIETVESTPDTLITLVDGKTFMVKEPVTAVVRLVRNYRRHLHSPFRKFSRKTPEPSGACPGKQEKPGGMP